MIECWLNIRHLAITLNFMSARLAPPAKFNIPITKNTTNVSGMPDHNIAMTHNA